MTSDSPSDEDEGLRRSGGKLIEREEPVRGTALPRLKLTNAHSRAIRKSQ